MTRRPIAIADLAEGVILATAVLEAPPERVFRALATDEVTTWWGSAETYRTTKFSIELPGPWRSDGTGADGSSFHVAGEVLEVAAPTRLVQTWRPSWDDGPATKVAYALEAVPAGTRITVRHDGFAGRAEACTSHRDGWELVLGWLAAHLATPKQNFLVRLIPPRPSFVQDMSADERAVMAEHGAFWRGMLGDDVAIAFGPVLDPKGPWGLGLIAARDEAAVRTLEAADPATKKLGMHYEVMPMFALVH